MSGMVVQNNKNQGLELFGVVYGGDEDLVPQASDSVYPPGTILARLTATGNLVPYDSGGVGGAEIPVAILGPGGFDAGGSVSAQPVRPIISGRVKEAALWHTNGTVSTEVTPLTKTERDALRDVSIVVELSNDFSKLDNQ